MTLRKIGMWVWGGVTIVLAAGFLFIVMRAGLCVDQIKGADGVPQFLFSDCSYFPGLFYAVKENGNLVAGILGFSGLAWSHFYSGGSKPI
jgi:hypothetical protein